MNLLRNVIYRKIYNISHTKSQNLNVSRLVFKLSLSNLLKPGVKSKMKMKISEWSTIVLLTEVRLMLEVRRQPHKANYNKILPICYEI